MLVIRLQTPTDPEPIWAIAGKQPAEWTHGTWERLLPLAHARGQELVVLIPSRDVLLTHVDVKTRNQRQMQQAVPFALEDSIAGELEEQHIVWQARPDSSIVDVAVIRRERLREWLTALRAKPLHPKAILPDVFALPWAADTTTLWQQGSQVWLRTGLLSGYSTTASALPLVLASLSSGHSDAIPLRLYSDQASAWQQDTRFRIQPETQAEHLLASSLQPALKLNLLNGWQEDTNNTLRQHWQRWKLAAGLAITAGLLGVGIYGVESYRLQQQLSALDTANLQLFGELFPEATHVDPRSLKSRLASELARLGGQQTAPNKTSTLDKLHTFATALAQTGGVSIDEIRAQERTLTISLQAQNQQAIDSLRDNLEKTLGNPVELQSSRTANSVKATLTLGDKS